MYMSYSLASNVPIALKASTFPGPGRSLHAAPKGCQGRAQTSLKKPGDPGAERQTGRVTPRERSARTCIRLLASVCSLWQSPTMMRPFGREERGHPSPKPLHARGNSTRCCQAMPISDDTSRASPFFSCFLLCRISCSHPSSSSQIQAFRPKSTCGTS